MAGERVQRRLAAILAADIVGYSRLMDADETGTLARLKSLRDDVFDPTVARFGGRIFKLTGDGALVEFASAVDAVQAAVDVQRALERRNAALAEDERQSLRIGVSLGDVIVEDDDLYGNGVNVAARLEAMAEPGGICISGTVHEQTRNVGDIGFEDLGEQRVKNIDRPIQAYRVLIHREADGQLVRATTGNRATWRWAAIAGIVAMIVGAGGIAWWQPWAPDIETASVDRMKLPLPDKPSVAILPFATLGTNPDQGFFADGITEDIITNLAGLRGLFVVSRSSTFTYKGKAIDVRSVAEDLGVRHVVEGSVRRSGQKARITAQLIDAVSGHSIWANRYDRDIKDIFQVQDEIARNIAGKLNAQLMWTESKRRNARNLDAYHLVRRAQQEFLKVRPEANRRARQLAQRAIELDPNFARAYSVVAHTHAFDARWGWVSDRAASGKKAFEAAKKAIAVDDREFTAYHALGTVLHGRQLFDQAISAYEKAISLNPNNADLLATSSNALLYAGRFDDAIRRIRNAMRLNPYYRWFYPVFLGRAYFGKGEFEKALPLFKEGIRIDPRNSVAIRYVVAINGHIGNQRAATAAIGQLLQQIPSASVKELERQLGRKAAELGTYLDGLRKAGLRESTPRNSTPPPLSIVVLPFDNLSGDKSKDYLADVITDQLTTYLSRIPGTFVIARNTAFTFKGKPVDVKKVGGDLGVRFVLEGSVQPAGDRIRVNAQLIDADTGAHLWAQKFDRSQTDRFRMQDEIVARVSRALHIQLSEVEAARLSQPTDSNSEAGTLAIRCEAIFLRWGPARKQTQAGYRLCEQALRRDATNVRALSLLAIRHGFRVATGQSDDRPQDIKRSTEFAERAIAADPNYYMARYAKAVAHSVRGEHRETIIEAKHALDLNPSFVTAYMFMLAAGVYTGQPEKTIEWAAEATRISPRDPLVSAFIAFTGRAYFMLGKDDLAAKWLRDSVIRNPRFPQNRIFLAGVLGASGHESEASEMLKTYLSLKRTRSKTIAQWKRELRTKNPQYVATFERLTEGLRKAGMPEN